MDCGEKAAIARVHPMHREYLSGDIGRANTRFMELMRLYFA
jgi:hypothetical protein